MQFCLNTLETTLHRSKPYAMLSERLQTTLYKKKTSAMNRVSPSGGGTGADPPPLHEKLACPPMFPPLFWPQNADFVIFIQFLAIFSKLSPPLVDPNWQTLMNVVLILLGQHCTGENSMNVVSEAPDNFA